MSQTVWDFAHVCNATPDVQVAPHTPLELRQLLQNNWNDKSGPLRVCIKGAGYSHGGHTMASGAVIRIDMRHLNNMYLGSGEHSIHVQAGATWHQVLDFLERETDSLAKPDTKSMSVAEMQSYGNFSVGGAVSVNCHGRSTRFANVGDTILSLTIQPVDGGPLLTALPGKDLFRAVVGGYGGVGIIVSVELILVPNVLLKRTQVTGCSGVTGIVDALAMARDPDVVMYNGVIYPSAEKVIVHTCFKTVKRGDPDIGQHEVDALQRLQPKFDGGPQPIGEFLLRRVPGMKQLRAWWGITTHYEPELVWRNWELGYDVDELEPLWRWPTTSVLQEYFVPPDKASMFLLQLQNVLAVYRVNILNISLRHIAPTHQDPFLNYASTTEERIALVLYINIWNTAQGLEHVKVWTQTLVHAALHFGGTYYLPYLPVVSRQQFLAAYPRVSQFRQVKNRYDPKNLLCNQFLDTYVMSDQ